MINYHEIARDEHERLKKKEENKKYSSEEEYKEEKYSSQDVNNAMDEASKHLKENYSVEHRDLELFKGKVRKILNEDY